MIENDILIQQDECRFKALQIIYDWTIYIPWKKWINYIWISR